VWVEGKSCGELRVKFVSAHVSDAMRLLPREPEKQKVDGLDFGVIEQKCAYDGLGRGVELSPAGPCGLGPLIPLKPPALLEVADFQFVVSQLSATGS